MDKLMHLRKLHVEDESSFAQAVQAFEGQVPVFDFALHYRRSRSFQQFFAKHENLSQGINPRDGFVPNTFLVAVVEDQVVGRLSIRHKLNHFLQKIGGRIGYGVVPTCRGRE